MRRYRKWVLTLGLMAATPSVTMADGFLSSILKPREKPAAKQQAGKAKNQQVAEQIAAALRGAQLNGYDIEIEFKGGTATLRGKIQSAEQRAVATRVVEQVDGVKLVDNQMTTLAVPQTAPVKSPIQQVAASATAASEPTNQATAEAVARSLAQAGLSGFDVEIRFKDGTASLGGSVATAEQKARASHVAGQVPGVKQVANGLSVLQPNAGAIQQTAFQAPPAAPAYTPAMAPGAPVQAMPMNMSNNGQMVYNMPNMPEHSWPSYASYPNYAQVSYPTQYSASAWPYIGPFYPYPQVPLGWRKVQMEWDDGYWNLNFNPRTDRWWWFMNPKNW